MLTTAITAALDGLAENWVSGIYLSGLSSGPKTVRVISLIPAILLQCNCPSPACKRDRELFVAIRKKRSHDTKSVWSRHFLPIMIFHIIIAKVFIIQTCCLAVCYLWNGKTPYDSPACGPGSYGPVIKCWLGVFYQISISLIHFVLYTQVLHAYCWFSCNLIPAVEVSLIPVLGEYP